MWAVLSRGLSESHSHRAFRQFHFGVSHSRTEAWPGGSQEGPLPESWGWGEVGGRSGDTPQKIRRSGGSGRGQPAGEQGGAVEKELSAPFSSVAQSRPTLGDPVNRGAPGTKGAVDRDNNICEDPEALKSFVKNWNLWRWIAKMINLWAVSIVLINGSHSAFFLFVLVQKFHGKANGWWPKALLKVTSGNFLDNTSTPES